MVHIKPTRPTIEEQPPCKKQIKKTLAGSRDNLSPQSIWKIQLRNRRGQKIAPLDSCISILCSEPTAQRLAIIMVKRRLRDGPLNLRSPISGCGRRRSRCSVLFETRSDVADTRKRANWHQRFGIGIAPSRPILRQTVSVPRFHCLTRERVRSPHRA